MCKSLHELGSREGESSAWLSRRRRTHDRTEIAFAISAENIYVRQTLDANGRLVDETLISPNHLLERTYSYPGH